MNEAPDTRTPTAFADLPIHPRVLKAVRRAGYDAPTDVQAQIIPLLAEGRDVLAQSQTGTGKTAAFALPILSKLDLERRVPQVLVLAPTRELAIQVSKSFATYGRDLAGFAVTTIYGGQDYRVQLDALRRGVHVVVGTPGRLIDLIERKALDLSQISTVVLDEADEMLAMGFIEDVERVLSGVPEPRQIALFSATMPGAIRRIAQRYQNEPEQIRIEAETMTADSIRQRAVFVHERAKTDVLLRLLQTEDTDGVIVFTRTKDATANLAEALRREGVAATALNGDMPQRARERTIDKLKSGALDVLTATDVAARGLDVARVSHVFNFDAPRDTQSYIHRVGRTGRAGRAGEAILFLTKAQRSRLRRIERATGQPIEVVPPPSPAEVEAKRTARLLEQVEARVRGADLASVECLVTQYAEASGTPLAKVAAALAQMALGDRPLDGRAPRADGGARGRDRNGEMPGRRRDRDGGAEDTRVVRRDRANGERRDDRSWRDRGDGRANGERRDDRSWRDRGDGRANGERRDDRSWRDRSDARANGEHRDDRSMRDRAHGDHRASWRDRGDAPRVGRDNTRPMDKGAPPKRRFAPQVSASGMDNYRLDVGADDGVQPKNIVGAISNEAGIPGHTIGAIRIHDQYTTVELPEGMPRETYRVLRRTWVAGKSLGLTRIAADGRPLPPSHQVVADA